MRVVALFLSFAQVTVMRVHVYVCSTHTLTPVRTHCIATSIVDKTSMVDKDAVVAPLRPSCDDAEAAGDKGRAFTPTHTSATFLCPLCGTACQANASNLCPDCLRGQVNLGADIQPTQPVIQCKRCHRWQAKNKHVRMPSLVCMPLPGVIGV